MPIWPPPQWGAAEWDAAASSSSPSAAAGPRPYQTKLPPEQEREFRLWLSVSKAPFDPSPKADYDMRGYWRALRTGDPRAATATSPGDKQTHYPDTWKTPYHKTFSNESIYAPPGLVAPRWIGGVLVSSEGRIIADERSADERSAEEEGAPAATPSRARQLPRIAQQRRAAAAAESGAADSAGGDLTPVLTPDHDAGGGQLGDMGGQ